MSTTTTGTSQTPARRTAPLGLLVTLAFGGSGLVLLIIGVILMFRTVTVVMKEPTVTGSIVAITYHQESVSSDDQQNGDRGDRWTPTIEYKVGGKAYHIDGSEAKSATYYKTGTAVNVRYDPAHPENAQIDSFASIWLVPVALIVFGVPFSLIGLAMLRSTFSGGLKTKT